MTIPNARTVFATCAFLGVAAFADDRPRPVQKTEHFDSNPGWEGVNNRLMPESLPTITQDFGYSETGFASKTKGEIGGTLRRASVPAWYADKIAPKSLDDRLTASGTFAITKPGSGNAFLGWFNSKQTEGTARPVGSLGLEIGAKKAGGHVHVRLHTAENRSAGVPVVPAGERKDRGAFGNDGSRYAWKLDYDPQANGGKGRASFTIRGDGAAGPVDGETFTLDLPDGYRKQGT